MSKLSIQDWTKTIDDYYPHFFGLQKFSNDITSYNNIIQDMKKPLDFENIHNYIKYCYEIKNQLNQQKIDNHIKLNRALGLIDEFHLMNETPSERLLAKYINYLKK